MMNIINFILPDRVPLLNTYDYTKPKVEYQHQDTSGIMALKKYNLPKNVWYCMITTPQSLELFDIKELLGEENYQLIMTNKLLLVIDLPFEPFYQCIDSVYKHVINKHNILPKNVIFMSNMYDAATHNKQIYRHYSLTPIRILWYPSLELDLNYKNKGETPNTQQIKPYDKKFINLNRRWRMHRPLMTLLLHYKNLLQYGHVSLGPCEGNTEWPELYQYIKNDVRDNPELLKMVEDADDVKNLPALYVDTEDLNTNWVDITPSLNKFYEDTYFSVVSETTFYSKEKSQSSRFLTEKTFKTIVMKHPFVLISIPRSLEVLRKLGYKTFSPYIDESYDHETDDHKRMLMILAEIERLCNLNEQELETFLNVTRDICEYNFNVLYSKNNFIYEIE